MSSARWKPEQGQWGWFGSHGGSREGKLRRWLGDQPGGMASKMAPGTTGIEQSRAFKPIQGLGPEKYYSRPSVSSRWNIFSGGNYHATPWAFGKHYVDPKVKHLTRDPLGKCLKLEGMKSKLLLIK